MKFKIRSLLVLIAIASVPLAFGAHYWRMGAEKTSRIEFLEKLGMITLPSNWDLEFDEFEVIPNCTCPKPTKMESFLESIFGYVALTEYSHLVINKPLDEDELRNWLAQPSVMLHIDTIYHFRNVLSSQCRSMFKQRYPDAEFIELSGDYRDLPDYSVYKARYVADFAE